MYSSLLENMLEYFYDVQNEIDKELEQLKKDIEKNNSEGKKESMKGDKSKDLINKEILLNSTKLLKLLVRLNMFEVLKLEEKNQDPMQFYSYLLRYLLNIFTYDRRYKKYTVYFYESEKTRVRE